MAQSGWNSRFFLGDGEFIQQLPPRSKVTKSLNGRAIKSIVDTGKQKVVAMKAGKMKSSDFERPPAPLQPALHIDVGSISLSADMKGEGELQLDAMVVKQSTRSTYKLKRLREILGRGSSSIVHKSVLLDTLSVCAEKVISITDSSKRIQFSRELCALKAAVSPFIVRMYDALPNPYDGTLSVCLEFMDGGSLQDIVKGGGCSNEDILASITVQTFSGLSYLHSLRIIHRDLKPSNALISHEVIVSLRYNEPPFTSLIFYRVLSSLLISASQELWKMGHLWLILLLELLISWPQRE